MTIELIKVAMQFGEKELFSLDHLIFSTGDRIGIVGDNGTGKSTLLEILAGEIKPTTGSVNRTEQVTLIQQLADSETTESGGEQTKRKIRQAFQSGSGIILADEPTNHLDQKGVQFLEKQLQQFPGTVVIVSHNRDFLNRVTNKTLALEDQKVVLYEGNYEAYLEQKAIAHREQEKQFDYYRKEKRRLEQARQEVAKQSSQTRKAPRRMGNSEARLHRMGDQRAKKNLDNREKGLATRLEKLAVVEKKQQKKSLVIPFAEIQKLHRKRLIEIEDYSLKVAQKVLAQVTDFYVINGSKTALLGVNGAGKTSLFKEILAKNPAFYYAQGLSIGYFSQNFEQLALDKSIYQNVREDSSYSEQEVRDLLAHMQFRGAKIHQLVGTLSGGERNKVAISRLLLSKHNLLVLDEPTNHLDISSIEVLEEALVAYQGTILFTSHDAAFVEKVATERWEIKEQQVMNLRYQHQEKAQSTQLSGERLLLETRKTEVLSALSFATGDEKVQLEHEFQKILTELRR